MGLCQYVSLYFKSSECSIRHSCTCIEGARVYGQYQTAGPFFTDVLVLSQGLRFNLATNSLLRSNHIHQQPLRAVVTYIIRHGGSFD